MHRPPRGTQGSAETPRRGSPATVSDRPRRTRAGGARKRPARYADAPPGDALRRALHDHRKGALRDATLGYREALARDPGDLDAWMNLGAVCVLRGHGPDARDAFARARALRPDDPRVLRDIGIGLASLGHFREARDALDACLARDPAQLGARLALSRACGEDGDPEAARRHAALAAAHAPDDPSAWIELHRSVFDDRDLAPARDAAERALALAPRDPAVRVLCAAARWRAGDEPGGRALLEDAVPEGLRAMVEAAVTWRGPETRAFSYKRDAIAHAWEASRGDGPVLEFGVRHGVSARVLAARAPRVHGFDSFAGLPAPWHGLPAGAFSTEGVAPELPENVTLHVGLFSETLPGFVGSLKTSPRLVHIDSDLYASARDALFGLGPHIAPGCVLLFDEYLGNADWRDDEHRALCEARARFGWTTAPLSLSWVTGQAAFRVVEAR